MPDVAYLGVGVLIGAAIAYVLLKNRQDDLKSVSEHLIMLAKQKLEDDKKQISTDMEGKKDAIKSLVEEIRKQLKDTDEKLRQSDRERIDSFSALKKELETHKQLTTELRGSTDQLKNILSNNQMRGAFGERIAEDLLKVAGFVVNQDYKLNKAMDSGPNRPDITLILPDGVRVNIDVKFPYSSLQKYVEATNKEDKARHLAAFGRDVRDKIKQIATRDYISPDDNTVDFAVAFIPNEMIFSFIYEQMNDIWEEAMGKKVVLAGPYSFVALLRLVKQAHSNFRLQSNIHQIIQLVQKFRQEYEKFSGELDALGNRLESASRQFQTVASTRDRQLNRVIDQIEGQQVIEGGDSASGKKLLD